MPQIKKRDGELASFAPTKILNRIKKAAKGLKVNTDKIFIDVITAIPADGIITTGEIDTLVANIAAPYTGSHYDYSRLAANVAMSSFNKQMDESFEKAMRYLKEQGILNNTIIDKIEEFGADNIQAALDFDRDSKFDYFAWKTFESMYLLKDSAGKVSERPQHLYMRVALTVTRTFEEAVEVYNVLSLQEISMATPIQLNSGTTSSQLSSCVLHFNEADSRQGLLNTLNDISNYSSNAAGIGVYLGNMRSKDSFISTSGGKAGGPLKYTKIINEALRFFNQQGKRPGVSATYFDIWHKDIFDILDMRKNSGKEELRARDVFSAIMISDNFMRALIAEGDWYLFCPNEVKKAGLKDFCELYGEEFEVEYDKAVAMGIGTKVKAQELFLKIYESQIETGTPYILYKDHINNKSNHQNYGTIKQSNLCAEIVEFSGVPNDTYNKEGEVKVKEGDTSVTAICTLASQVLKNYINGKSFDFEKLVHNTGILVRSLNNVIDINNYSSEKGRRGALQQRALAIGVQGLADVFYILDYTFTSPEAKKLNMEIFEAIYYGALDASSRLCEEGVYEPYDGFYGSPISKGIFQFDMWEGGKDKLSGRFDWEELRGRIMKYGVCNSLVTAQMPVASSAKVTNSYEMTEPMDSNLFSRRVIGGEFLISNRYLINDLEKIDIWNEAFKNEIIMNGGSIQGIDFMKFIDADDKNFSKKIKRVEHLLEKYKTVWEFKQRDLIDLCVDRAVFIDQTQSMNLYFADPSTSKLMSSMVYTWRNGLKTGNYYIRTKAVSTGAKHLAIDISNTQVIKDSDESSAAPLMELDISKPSSSPFDCIGCSA